MLSEQLGVQGPLPATTNKVKLHLQKPYIQGNRGVSRPVVVGRSKQDSSPMATDGTESNSNFRGTLLRRPEPRVIVGIDFGTTNSGFAYALKSDPSNVYVFHEWPMQTEVQGKAYVKTATALWYVQNEATKVHELKQWGCPAIVEQVFAASCQRNSSQGTVGNLISRFKLHLASSELGSISAAPLPQWLTVDQAIKDFLSCLVTFILEEVKGRFGLHIRMADIQFALTVPAIWDDPSKQRIKVIAEEAGLLLPSNGKNNGGSPHPLLIVLEPEAASIFCQLKYITFSPGDKYIVVDLGGGTVDLVSHCKLGTARSARTREVARSSGGLCGGTYVDQEFLNYMLQMVPCFEDFADSNPEAILALMSWWEGRKSTFSDNGRTVIFHVPCKLAWAWEAYDEANGNDLLEGDYDKICFTAQDMRAIFQPVVSEILDLIDGQLQRIPGCKAILAVGGFSQSPYVMKCIRHKFGNRVESITSPPDPGAAICQGAVLFGLNPGIIMSRVARKTYGVKVCCPFDERKHPPSKLFHVQKVAYCSDVFSKFVEIDQEVEVDEEVSRLFETVHPKQEAVSIILLSSDSRDPAYTTDPGVTVDGKFLLNLVNGSFILGQELEITMRFGRTSIEVCAKTVDLQGGDLEATQAFTFSSSLQ